MASTSQDGDSNTDTGQNLSPPNIRLSDTDRLETFSDGVFSITITLLVVDIVRPEYAIGHLLEKLQAAPITSMHLQTILHWIRQTTTD